MNLIPRDSWVDVDNVFDNFFAPMTRFGQLNDSNFFSPHVDIKDKKDHYEITAELPGVQKEDLDVNLENGVLTIEASHKEEKSEEENGKIIRKERRTGHFMRSFSLDAGVKEKDIKADFKNGLLTIQAPKVKSETPKAQKIKIS